MYLSFFILSSVNGHLGRFRVLAVVNSAAMNTGTHVCFSIMVFSGYMPRSGVAGSYGRFISSFTSILVSIMAVLVYTPTNSVGSESRSVVSESLRPHGLYIYSPWNSPGQNTGVGRCSLLQGIFPTQGSNPGLLHCRRILYQLSHQGSTRIPE